VCESNTWVFVRVSQHMGIGTWMLQVRMSKHVNLSTWV